MVKRAVLSNGLSLADAAFDFKKKQPQVKGSTVIIKNKAGLKASLVLNSLFLPPLKFFRFKASKGETLL